MTASKQQDFAAPPSKEEWGGDQQVMCKTWICSCEVFQYQAAGHDRNLPILQLMPEGSCFWLGHWGCGWWCWWCSTRQDQLTILELNLGLVFTSIQYPTHLEQEYAGVPVTDLPVVPVPVPTAMPTYQVTNHVSNVIFVLILSSFRWSCDKC